VWRATVATICSIAAASFSSRGALADTGQECRDAYYKTQVLRDNKDLEEALKQADVCVRSCGNELAKNCAEWKADLEGKLASSIILEVVDASGARVTDATVSLDGELWLDQLDGSAHVISKGPHTIEINVKGSLPLEKPIVIRQGEKDRKILISLGSKPPPDPPSEGHRIGPWILVGIGGGALIAGAVTGGIVVVDYGVMKDNCNEQAGTCSQDGLDASSRGQVLGPVTTGLLVAGGALAAGGIIWFVAAPREEEAPATSYFVAPVASGQEQGIVFGGSW
jgi:hypothetical protein